MIFLKESEKVALIYDDRKITYSETAKGAKSFSEKLDIQRDDRVVIFMENRPEILYGLLGIFDKRGISVNLDGSFTGEELVYYLKDCTPKYIICSHKTYEEAKKGVELSGLDIEIIIGEEVPLDYKGTDLKIEIDEKEEKDKVMFILYTSGTTGNPKGVMLTFDNLLVNLEGLMKYKMFNSEDRVLGILPMHHILPLLGSGLLPIVYGATLVFLKEVSSQALVDALKKYKITIIIGVPKLWEMLHKKIMGKINEKAITKGIFALAKKINNKSFSKKIFKKVHEGFGGAVRFFVSGGSKLDKQISEDFLTLGFDICEGYGLTETAPMISFTPINKVIPGCAGEIINDVEVKITDEGEILVKGRNVMKGYYNKPEATAEAIKDGWFYTGDLGHVIGKNLYVTGRKKEMIVLSNGKNINPIEIEQWLISKSDLIKEVAIIDYENKLTALIYPDFYKLHDDGVTNILETFKLGVIDEYNKQAPSYKKVLDVKIVQEEFPKTKIGKLRRFMLKDLLEEKKVEKKEIEEPNTKEYKEISKYIKSLKNKVISPKDHLELDLGLDSLEIVELLTFIESSFGIKIDEKTLVENATVEKLAEYVEKISKEEVNHTNVKWKDLLTAEVNITSFPKSNLVGKLVKLLLKIFVFTFYIKIDKKGLENTKTNEPVIFAGNHQSFLDGFMLNQTFSNDVLDKTCYFAKSKYFVKPHMKFMGENSNIILVDINKNLINSLQLLGKAIKSGYNIVIFPEGTRTRDGKLGKFKKFFAILAQELNIPIVPFVIKGAYDLYPPSAKYPRSGKVSIEFLDKVYPDKNLSHEEFAEKIKEIIAKELKEDK
ncbi:MAG: AMP-binding protein [Fusobacterium perfoetens]|uniref:AMP-binding protein n=1 Tax=Fusobacterium perfoetens TaxID=852 RepID=UPI0023F4B4DC|nr:AMP-binding protein [Fusobacterium perfoetens]MCI6151795.1 AMP-binding protein [Fusobacterium perfoetens]MDY3236844.1 AMP-binding protein [Fusobacterium perfoetens]